jgi:hypothetical protein
MDAVEESPDGLAGPPSESRDQPSPKPSLTLDTNMNGAREPDVHVEQDEDDAVSIETTTDQLFYSASEAVVSKEHKLGLDINPVWGWSGSAYDDYEYENLHIVLPAPFAHI